MTDQQTMLRLQREAQHAIDRHRASEAATGIFNGIIIGAFLWAGLYGFVRLMVGIFGSGR